MENIPVPPMVEYSDESAHHRHIHNIRQVIHDYSLPEASALLDELRELTTKDLKAIGYLSTCQCGCQERVNVWKSLTMCCDVMSLRYILRRELLALPTLVDLLAEMLANTGTMITKIRVGCPNEDVYNYITNCVDVLLPYLCERCPDLIRDWRDPEHDINLFHSVYRGYAPSERISDWARILLRTGCDPLHNPKTQPGRPALRSALISLDVEIVRLVLTSVDSAAIRTVLNSPTADHNAANQLMLLLDRCDTEKNPMWLAKMLTMIELLVPLTDLSHTDSFGRNVSDYIEQYGYKSLFAEKLPTLVWPAPTGRPAERSRWDEQELENSQHSDYTRLLYRHRYAKSTAELAQFRAELAQLPPQARDDDDDNVTWRYNFSYVLNG